MMPSTSFLAASILSAPSWAQIALTAPKESLRRRGALELAESIVDCLENPPPVYDERQIDLPL